MAAHVRAMVELQDAGAEVFDYGNSIRDEARKGGYDRAFEFPGFVPAYIRPLFCEGKGPFRWAALSGDPADIAATDRAILELFPDNERLRRWITMAGERVAFQGLPARICWLGYGERHLAGLKFNEMVASGELKAPIVIGRDHLDCGSVASPYRETEAMADGSDAIADWPLLNALVNTASGASWVSIHHGGGVGIGRSIHAGQVCVADGTPLAAEKIERVLTNDPAHGRDPPRRRRLRPGRRGRRGARACRSRCRRLLDDAARRLRGDVARSRAGRPLGRVRRLLPPALGERRARVARLVPRARPPPASSIVEEDPYGNLIAWWNPSSRSSSSPRGTSGRIATPDAVLTGSHLDSVLDGGAYDGPLGVVSALAALDLMRERGVEPSPSARRRGVRGGGGLPVRPGLPRLATGDRVSPRLGRARELTDRDGVALGEVIAGGRSAGLAGRRIGCLRRTARRAGPGR